MRRRGFVTILLVDPAGPYFWMEVRGRVVNSTTDGAMEHMHVMAKKYTGRDTYTSIREEASRTTAMSTRRYVVGTTSNLTPPIPHLSMSKTPPQALTENRD